MHGRVAALALAALLVPAAAAAAAVPPGNLLANPGAEAGPGAPDAVAIDPPPGWTAIGNVSDVPPGTRAIGARLDLVRVEGAYNDGYADNLSLTLGTGPVPAFHKTVVAGVVSGTIRFRKPGARSFVQLTADQALPLGSTLDTT